LKLPLALVAVAAIAAAGCRSSAPRPPQAPGSAPESGRGEDTLVVKKVQEELVVAAWAEPSHLAFGGGDAQVLVRVQRRGGAPFAGVEVRLHASLGSLFSNGHILITDERGMTRDRLTTHKTATVTLNAGGTRYSFKVPVADKPE